MRFGAYPFSANRGHVLKYMSPRYALNARRNAAVWKRR